MITEKQKVLSPDEIDRDCIAYVVDDLEICVEFFFIRSGKLLGKRSTFLSNEGDRPNDIFNSFISQYYLDAEFIPEEILLGDDIQDKETLEKFLRKKRGKKVRVLVPKKGEKSELVKMVRNNGEISLRNHRDKLNKEKALKGTDMLKLKKLLQLERLPDHIEAFDISNMGNDDIVGAMVVFKNGSPDKGSYRRYKIKDVIAQDDYASMQEVLKRRFAKISSQPPEDHPKLLLIDGGEAHLKVANRVLQEYGLSIPVFGMAKDDKHRTSFLAGLDGNYVLKNDRDTLRFISSIQEEVHRFALSYHKTLRKKRYRKSILDSIEGVGPKKKKILMTFFGSVENIKNASLEELKVVKGIDPKTASTIFDFFKE